MLRFFVLLVALLAAQSQAEKRFYALEDAEHHFEEFIVTFNRQYANEAEKNFRLNIFKENLMKINELNRNGRGIKGAFGITKFSDLSSEEFKQKYTGMRGVSSGGCSPAGLSSNVSAPDSFDWRTKGAVTPVRNQGNCGSCWAFGAAGNIEGQYAIKYGSQVQLSEQQLVDCAQDGCQGCTSGYPDRALAYVASSGGIMKDSDYPYQEAQANCQFDQSRVAVRLSGCNDYTGHSEDQLKDILASVGPLSVAVDASHLQQYTKGEIFDCGGPGTINHAVLLVGYGNDGGKPYWIIKNSWGTNWGDDGYFKLAYGTNSCSVTNAVYSGVIG